MIMKPILLICTCLQASTLLPLPSPVLPVHILFKTEDYKEDLLYFPDGMYGQPLPEAVLNPGWNLLAIEYAFDDSEIWQGQCDGAAGTWHYKAVLENEEEQKEYSGQFVIQPKNLNGLELDETERSDIHSLEIYDGEILLEEGRDYICDTDNTSGDSGFLQITFIGNYAGSAAVKLFQPGFVQDESGIRLEIEKNIYATGWQEFNNAWYFFDENGYMQTGWIKDIHWYWCDPNTGQKVTSAWITDDSGRWYVNEEGIYIPDGWKKDDSGWRYVLGDSTCYNDGFHKINKLWYYFGSDGYMKTGWIKDSDNKEYYLDPSGGWMHKSEWIDGKYYVDNTGAYQITRWKQSSNGKWWLRWPDGSYPVSSFQKVNGKTYYFDKDGYMVTGWQTVNSSEYYFDASGSMLTNQYIDNRYLQSDGKALSVFDTNLYSYCQQVYASQGRSLYNCFWWVADNMTFEYLPRPWIPDNGMTEFQNYAAYGFENMSGNCYVWAAMFCCLAQNLGYEAKYVDGYIYVASKDYYSPHGWVEILEDGIWYIYDPEVAWEIPKYNFYRTTIAQAPINYRYEK